MVVQEFQIKKGQAGKNPYVPFLVLVFLCLWLAGCALSAQRAHSEFEARLKTVARPVLMPPDVSLLELMPSGLIRQRGEWSAAACSNLQNALLLHLKDKNYTPKLLETDSSIAPEIAEIQALYRLVHKSMKQQTFNSRQGVHSDRRFEYSLGPMRDLLNRMGADAMIFVSGYDRISMAGRKALVDLAIADASGAILYYSVKGTIRGSDLRDPASANDIVQELLSGISRMEG